MTDLQRVEQRISERRHEKAQYFASLLFLLEIPSNHLDLNSDFEWLELQRAAETDGKTYGVPNSETRLMILALLREMERRRGCVPRSAERRVERVGGPEVLA